jgi:phytoene dehydrogenase-like protein
MTSAAQGQLKNFDLGNVDKINAMANQVKNYDAIIIGGGISGLAAAALLTKQGHACLVLEKLPILGGRCRVVEKKGFVLDYGIHSARFAEQGALGIIEKKLGIPRRFQHVGKTKLHHAGRMQPFPLKPGALLGTNLLSVSSKLKLLFHFVPAMLRKPEPADFQVSVADWLRKKGLFISEVSDLFSALCCISIVCPDIERASFGEIISMGHKVLRTKTHSGYPLGGYKHLIEAFSEIIRSGGDVLCGAPVEKVVIENGIATGVVAGGEFYSAKCVAPALPVQEIGEILDTSVFDEETRGFISGLEPTGGISYDVCLSRRVTSHNGAIVTFDPFAMALFPSNLEPALAPRGKQLGTWLYPIPVAKLEDKEFIRLEQARLKNLALDMFPKMRDCIEYERLIVMKMVDGAMPAIGQTSYDRPKTGATNIPNIFLSGDSLGYEGLGGDTAFYSAIACADAAAKYLETIN